MQKLARGPKGKLKRNVKLNLKTRNFVRRKLQERNGSERTKKNAKRWKKSVIKMARSSLVG